MPPMRRPPFRRRASRRGLSQPLFVTAAPGDTSRLFIVEKTGTIKILDLNTGTVLGTPFLTVPVDIASERGLLGLAFDPDYASNGLFYIYRTSTRRPPHNEVERYQVSGNPNVANAASRQTVTRSSTLDQRTNHNAGWIGFGPDGYLYIASGEIGVAATRRTLTNLLGKILRIDVERRPAVPDPVRQSVRRRRRRRAAGDLRLRPAQSVAGELRFSDRQSLHRRCRREHRSRKSISARTARTTAGRSPKDRARTRPSSIRSRSTVTAPALRSPAAMSITAKATG